MVIDNSNREFFVPGCVECTEECPWNGKTVLAEQFFNLPEVEIDGRYECNTSHDPDFNFFI